jgi:hypothetical protein
LMLFFVDSLTFFGIRQNITDNKKTSFMQQSTSSRPKTYLTINWYGETEKNNPCRSHLSSLLQCYAFYGQVPFCMPSWLLLLECMQKFTNHLGWIDSASFNQIIAVGVWHSCFWVYINLLDLLLSTVRAFYIIFCQLEVNLTRVNN